MRELISDSWTTTPPKGTYNIVAVTQLQRSVRVACPECGAVQEFTTPHITPEGEVRPALLCACGFHELVRLKGWTEPRPQVATAMRRTSSRGG